MSYRSEDYVKAFSELLEEGVSEDVAINGLLEALEKNGDKNKAESIVARIEKSIVKKNGGRSVVCEIARDVPQTLKDKIRNSFQSEDRVMFSIEPELVAGTRITFDGEYQLDRSFKAKLKRCFSN